MSEACLYQVLSIDDSKAVHAFLDRCAQEKGLNNFQFHHAYDVKSGLALLSTKNEKLLAILLDWEMPEITGIEALPKIKAQYPGLPVIMLTSKNDPDDIVKILELGASDYMMKPFTPDILFEKLMTVVGDQSRCCRTTG